MHDGIVVENNVDEGVYVHVHEEAYIDVHACLDVHVPVQAEVDVDACVRGEVRICVGVDVNVNIHFR